MPDVTVLMPVYNAMPFLPMAVESVLAQSLSAFEFLIVDDGSTDGTCAYLGSLRDHRVKVVRRPHEGTGATRNAGFRECDTEYVAFMDGDDLIHPRRLETQLKYLTENLDVCMVGCQVEFLVGAPTGLIARVPLEHNEIVERLLSGKSGVSQATLMMRSRIIQRIGGYRVASAGEDIDFCLRMCEAGRAANLADVYYYYRLHPSSVSLRRRPELRMGFTYGVEAAKRRRNGSPEPGFEDFQTWWEQRGLTRKLVEVLEDWATWQYRRSIVDRAEGRRLRGYCRLLVAAAAQPHWCVWHLRHLRDRLRYRQERDAGVASGG